MIEPTIIAHAAPVGEGRERGDGGVFLMGLYEIPVLDSLQSKTYADGQASAGVRAVPAAGERFQTARAVAGLRHHFS